MTRRVLLFLAVFSLLCTAVMPAAFADNGSYVATEGIVIPDFTKDFNERFEIPDTEAMRFVQKLSAGWNLGNTFDAYLQDWNDGTEDCETVWSGAKTTPELIHAIREAGFNLIRIPVSWHDHLTDENHTIDPAWLDRVEEVAGWAVAEGMYAIVNIHHDNTLEYLYPDTEHYDQSEKYVTAIWRQVAEKFKDYDEHIIFESMNEPRLVGTPQEWKTTPEDPVVADSMMCINKLNQAFVDTIRAAGGFNPERFLMIPGYDGSVYSLCFGTFELPKDPRIILEGHGYIPYEFALNRFNPDSEFDLEKSEDKKGEIRPAMDWLYDTQIRHGVPVIIDEFGALHKDDADLQARVNFAAFYTATASARGIPVVWWDNSCFNPEYECFAIIERNEVRWVYPDIAMAIMTNCRVNRPE